MGFLAAGPVRAALGIEITLGICRVSNFFSVLGIKLDQTSNTYSSVNDESHQEKDRLCPDCFSVLANGFSHQCNDFTALENLKRLLDKRRTLVEAFAVYVIKSTEPSHDGTCSLSQLHGKKLPVTIGHAKPLPDKIPLHKIAQFASENNLSQKQCRKIGTFLGKNKVKIEVGLQRELVVRNHILDPFMEVKKLQFLINGKIVEKPTVIAKSASDLVMHVHDLRKQNPQDFLVKLFFDNGQDYLKLS